MPALHATGTSHWGGLSATSRPKMRRLSVSPLMLRWQGAARTLWRVRNRMRPRVDGSGQGLHLGVQARGIGERFDHGPDVAFGVKCIRLTDGARQ